VAEPRDEINVRLQLRWDAARTRWWIVVPFEIDGLVNLAMAPNTIATRSVITPPALALLRAAGLAGADIHDLRSGAKSFLLTRARLGGHPIPNLEVRVHDVDQFRDANGDYPVDGYLGLDFLLRACAWFALDTRRLRMGIRLR
jgi:hypothetical protein